MVERSQLQRIIDQMEDIVNRLDTLQKRRARNDALEDLDDDEEDIEEEYDVTDPLAAPQQPFSDSPPQRIHGEPFKRDLFG